MAELTLILQTKWIAYAGIHTHDNSTAQSIPNGLTYTKVINFLDNDPSRDCTPDATNNKITSGVAGIFKIDGSFSFTASNNVTAFGALFINGVEQQNIHFTRKIGTAGDVGNTSFNGFVTLSALDELDFRLRHDDTGADDFTFSYMNLNMFQVDKV